MATWTGIATLCSGSWPASPSRDCALTAAATLTNRAKVGGRFKTSEEAPSLVRILFHSLREYARHVGHLDIVRELIDGTTGE